jgi:hypothetical protein
MTFTEIKYKQAGDLEERDLIRIDGHWRLVWDVYKTKAEVEADYNGITWNDYLHESTLPLNPDPFLVRLAAQVARLDDTEGMDGLDYVIVRYMIPDLSGGGSMEDATLMYWAYDLVEVQSQKAAEND